MQGILVLLCGGLLSAAALGNQPMPLPLGVLCAGLAGWPSLLLAVGSCLGYYLFWGAAGAQGMVWTVAGLVICLALGGRKLSRSMPWLMPGLAGLSVAVTGVLFQLWAAQQPAVGIYLLRVGLSVATARIAAIVTTRRDPVADWLACGLAVLALAQVSPISGLSLGFLAAGALGAAAPFPAAALAGLALDLSRISPVPMTAVLALAFFIRMLPKLPRWAVYAAPVAAYALIAPLCGPMEWIHGITLAVGGGFGLLLPPRTPIAHRRGETGMAQVRLELSAGVLAQVESLLLEVADYPIDETALVEKAVSRACSCCPGRKTCTDRERAMGMPTQLLHRPLVTVDDVPVNCRKRGRLLLELRRGQDQFRSIRADRERQKEYRNAVAQQFQFLSEYLQDLADTLPKRSEVGRQRFEPEVAVCSAGLVAANGDRCLWFAGTECHYYVLLCDGMGTGTGAEEEGRVAGSILRRLLTAGYPAAYALRSLNSLCTLRQRAGAVTVDLAEVDLRNGKVVLYKWGAAPSYLLSHTGAEKIGTAAAPPGLSITDTRETVDRLSLRQGQTLILLSDGVDAEAAMRRAWEIMDEPPEQAASKTLQYGRGNGSDDATVAVIRLKSMTG